MRRLLVLLTLIASCFAASASPAGAAPLDKATYAYVAFNPIFRVQTWSQIPPNFSTDAFEAVAAAKASRTMQALHRREHPLQISPFVWADAPIHWYITFTYRGRVVAEVDVGPKGRLLNVWTGPQAITPYTRGHYAPLFDSWWVVGPFSLAFLIPFFDPRRLRRLLHLDALVLLSFMGSYALFDHLALEPAVWLAYPPLLYLLARMLWLGWRRRSASTGLPDFLPLWLLAGGLILLTGARIALGILSHQVIDVSWASVTGAQHILSGQPLYSSIGQSASAHGDTYGPAMYLAFVPFLELLPWHGLLGFVPAAKAASVTFDVLTTAGLVLLGWRMRRGRQGVRLGLALGWVWAACPLTLLALMVRTNDGLIALLSVISLLVFSSPAARGALLGLAAAAKFTPAGLIALYAGPRSTSRRSRLVCLATFAGVLVLAILAYLPPGGFTELYRRTIEYQMTRVDVFSPWALHPSLAPLKDALEVLAVALVLAPALLRRERALAELAALAAAITIALQLPAVHWFYYYILWFLPFAAVALLAAPAATAPVDEPAGAAVKRGREPAPPEAILAGV